MTMEEMQNKYWGLNLSKQVLKKLDDGVEVYVYERDRETDQMQDNIHMVDTMWVGGKFQKVLIDEEGFYYVVKDIDKRELEVTLA